MRVLVIAQEGQIRDALEKQLTVRNRVYHSVGPEWFDSVATSTALVGQISQGIGLVVNSISLEQVTRNGDGADHSSGDSIDQLAYLAQACAQRNIPLLHLSSSAVFDGLDAGVHRESESPAPSSREGGILLRMEELVKGMCSQYLLLRSGPLFSSVGDNLLTRLLQRFEQASPLELSDNGDSCPMHASDLARVVSAIIDQLSCGADLWGAYHYCSADYVSHYQFARAVLKVAGKYRPELADRITLLATEELDPAWHQPLLNCEKILNTFGIKQLPWRAFIAPTVKKYFNPGQDPEEPMLSQSIQTVQKENFDG